MLASSQGETMTVKELIEALNVYPSDTPVITEGCDCFGAAVSVEVYEDEVLIRRP